MSYIKQHLKETIDIIDKIDSSTIERMVEILYEARENSGGFLYLVLVEAPLIHLML